MTSTGTTAYDLETALLKFGIYDYLVFGVMLVGCALIGIYYALKDRRTTGGTEEAAEEYLLGGRNMSVFPVSMSLVASFVSGISLLGTPTELYLYGTEFMFMAIGVILTGVVSHFIFLPVFHDLRLSSTYEYLERRFSKNVRLFGSLLFSFALICWLPIVVYVPALTFNQVTGVNVHIVTACCSIICIFYTCVGGMKAVVWTDLLQTWIMVGAMLAIIIKGTIDVGGLQVVWQRCMEGDRLNTPSFDPDPFIRHSFWSLTIGLLALWIQNSIISQNMVQRYLALPTLAHAKRALWIFTFGNIVMVYISCYAGLVLYATFHDCDPLTTKVAKVRDQLLPIFVMKVFGDYPGLPGVFVAGIFSASLSSLSTSLSSMSAVVLEDFVKTFTKRDLSVRATNLIMKSVVVVFGVACLALVVLVEKLGTVLQLSFSLSAMTSGPLFGIFTGGMLLPWVTDTGALFGGIIGLLANGLLTVGSQNAIAQGKLKFPTKPTSVEGCEYYFNLTQSSLTESTPHTDPGEVFPLFRLSYLWFTLFGGLVTIISAVIISFTCGKPDLRRVDPMTLVPWLRRTLPRTKSQILRIEEQELLQHLKKAKITPRAHQESNP